MSTASSRILLLGWNEVLSPPEAADRPLRTLVQQLAPLANVAVLLPHEPQPAFAVPDGTVRITGLAELGLDTLLESARPSPNPAAWHAPASPYIGSSPTVAGLRVPAAPYQGATPVAPAAPALPPTSDGSAGRLAEPDSLMAAPETPSASTPSEGDFPPVGRSSSRAGSAEISSPSVQAAKQPNDNPSALAEAAATLYVAPIPAPPLTRVHATLAQELAALGHNPPDATASDLNFQVIQYARFATSWACGKKFAVIYAVDWPTWLAAMEIRQLTGWPLVLHVRSLAQERAAANEAGWAVALERLALRRADLVLAASAEVAGLLAERYQLPPERLHTVSITNTAAINKLLLHIEHHRPGRPAVARITPPSA